MDKIQAKKLLKSLIVLYLSKLFYMNKKTAFIVRQKLQRKMA